MGVIVDDIPKYFKMFQYISHFYYGMELVMVPIYRNTPAPCDPADEEKQEDMRNGFQQLKKAKAAHGSNSAQAQAVYNVIYAKLSEACTAITTPEPDKECGNFARGKDLLDHFEYHEYNIARNMFCLLGITLG